MLNSTDVKCLRFKYDQEKFFIKSDEKKNLQGLSIDHGLKITKHISPQLWKIAQNLKIKIPPGIEFDVYIQSNHEINSLISMVSSNSFNIVLTSSLVNLMTKDELMFVIGHELAHAIFHHLYPLKVGLSPSQKSFVKNASEITCDRWAHIAINDKSAAYSSLLKLESGLNNEKININIYEYLSQFKVQNKDNMIRQIPKITTHPHTNLRMKALLLFEMSEMSYQLKGYKEDAPFLTDDIEQKILVSMIEESFKALHADEKETVKKFCFWKMYKKYLGRGNPSLKEQLIEEFGKDYFHNALLILQKEGKQGINARFNEKKYQLGIITTLTTNEIDSLLTKHLF